MSEPVQGHRMMARKGRVVRLALLAASAGVVSTPSAAGDRNLAGVEEVIVTAQRRAERLQEVPISISVLGGETLDRGSSRSVADVMNDVGGVSMFERAPGNAQIAVRGVMPDQGVGASTAAFYLDEVPFAFVSTSRLPDANAFDLERVEVLRGPQGTLYGANALSGAVRVLTSDAKLDDFEAKGRVRASETTQGGNNYGGDLALNVPLVPGKFAVRGVASYADLSGFVDSTISGKRDFNDARTESYRLKTNYRATDKWSLELGLSRTRVQNGGPSSAKDDELTTDFTDNQAEESDYTTYNLVSVYDWSTVSLLSSTSYVDFQSDSHPEILLGGVFRLNFISNLGLRSFAQEFRLNSNLAGPWQWTAGAMYKDTTETLLQNAAPLLPTSYKNLEGSKSYAAFGETTREFNGGKVALTTGLRYFADRVDSVQRGAFFPGPLVPPRDDNFDRTTGRVVLTLKPSPDRMFYGSISTGFRSGLIQPPAVTSTNPEFPDLKPDSLINYEVGTKGALGNGTFVYDTAVYYTEWDDTQQGLITPQGFSARVNAGKASGAGVDAGFTYQPNDAFALQLSVGWNGLELDEDVFSSGSVLFEKGARVNLSPEWTGSLGGSYRVDMPMQDVQAVLSANFAYRSSVVLRYLTGAPPPVTSESDDIRSLRASFGLQGARWSVDLYGDNLLNETPAVTPADLTIANNSVRLRPRTIGLQATFNY